MSTPVRQALAPKQSQPPDSSQGIDELESRSQLFASLYEELHRLAQRELRHRGYWLTLGATTLLHEVYLNLRGRQSAPFQHRARFLAYASRAMRGLILDYARSRRAIKRGAGFELTSLPTNVPEQVAESMELQRLSTAVDRLAAVAPRLAELIDLKYFGGVAFHEIAAMWEMSERTVQRDWEKARVFLHRALSDPEDQQP